MIQKLSMKAPNVVGNSYGISSRTKILGMDLIISQKVIANTLNLREKLERKKNEEGERSSTKFMVITGGSLMN